MDAGKEGRKERNERAGWERRRGGLDLELGWGFGLGLGFDLEV